MDVRRNYLERQAAIADSVSKVWSIHANDPITAIFLYFDATANTPDAGALPLLKEIDNLEIVDGSKVIWSGGASYLQAMAYGLGHKIGAIDNSENTTAERGEACVPIHFGRYYGDPEYFLDPKLLSNPQIKFTSSITAGAGDWTTGTLRCTIEIHTLAGKVSARKGMVYVKEVVAETIAANAEVRIDMPPDMPWRTLGIFSESSTAVGLHPVPTVLNAKLDINNGADIKFDVRSRFILQENIRRLGTFMLLEEEIDDLAMNQGQGLVLANITLETNYAAPYGGIFFPFDSVMPDDFWTPKPNDNLRLILTGGGTGGVARVFLAQIGK